MFTNISRSTCNLVMTLGQLIEHDMRNTFLEKWYTKYGGETIPRPFSKKWKLIISLDQFFIVCQVKEYRDILKLSCRPLAFTSSKNNKRSGASLLHHLLHNFWRKIFLLLYSITWPYFIVWLLLLCEILGNTCIVVVC